jgi:hypothetical protein
MRRLRAAGIFTQMAIAPMLPNHPQRSDRVIVDTDGVRARSESVSCMQMADADWFTEGPDAAYLMSPKPCSTN